MVLSRIVRNEPQRLIISPNDTRSSDISSSISTRDVSSFKIQRDGSVYDRGLGKYLLAEIGIVRVVNLLPSSAGKENQDQVETRLASPGLPSSNLLEVSTD
jgi:hypothetical protein